MHCKAEQFFIIFLYSLYFDNFSDSFILFVDSQFFTLFSVYSVLLISESL